MLYATQEIHDGVLKSGIEHGAASELRQARRDAGVCSRLLRAARTAEARRAAMLHGGSSTGITHLSVRPETPLCKIGVPHAEQPAVAGKLQREYIGTVPLIESTDERAHMA